MDRSLTSSTREILVARVKRDTKLAKIQNRQIVYIANSDRFAKFNVRQNFPLYGKNNFFTILSE